MSNVTVWRIARLSDQLQRAQAEVDRIQGLIDAVDLTEHTESFLSHLGARQARSTREVNRLRISIANLQMALP